MTEISLVELLGLIVAVGNVLATIEIALALSRAHNRTGQLELENNVKDAWVGLDYHAYHAQFVEEVPERMTCLIDLTGELTSYLFLNCRRACHQNLTVPAVVQVSTPMRRLDAGRIRRRSPARGRPAGPLLG